MVPRCRCIHFCHYLLHRTVGQKLSASQSRQTGKESMDSVRLRMDVTHRRFDVIVPRCVLQCERVRILPGLGQKCVPQSVQSCIRVGLDPGAQCPHLRLQYPGAKRLGGISWMGKDMVALRYREKGIQHCLHRAVDLEGTFARSPFQSTLNYQRTIEISLDWFCVKIHTVLHQVEHLAAAYTGVASQNRSGTQRFWRVADPFLISLLAEDVIRFTLRSLIPRILLDDRNLLNQL